MKLAEALILRADYHKRIEQLRQRMLQNTTVQEGDSPAENPTELLQEFEDVSQALTLLIQRINRSNVSTYLDDGQSLSDALALRDTLKLKHTLYRDIASAAAKSQVRYTPSEIKFISTVNIAALQQEADQLAKAYRELDTQIQALNWLSELLD